MGICFPSGEHIARLAGVIALEYRQAILRNYVMNKTIFLQIVFMTIIRLLRWSTSY